MIINEKTEIWGEKVVLVPYNEHLVPRYHEWMKSPELLENTASVALSLEEEYEMQKSWRVDDDKLTFIVLDKNKAYGDEIQAMIGDANLFLSGNNSAEVMIMIAEEGCRLRGFGQEALLLILRYGIENLGIQTYEAKISQNNTPSIRLFQKLEFEKTNESQVFKEITFTKHVTETWKENLNNLIYSIKERT